MLTVCYMPVLSWPGIHLLSDGTIEINDTVTCCQGWLHFDAALLALVSLLCPVTSAWTCFTASVSGITEFAVVWNPLCFSHSNVKLEVGSEAHTLLLHYWLPLFSWIYLVFTGVFLKSETYENHISDWAALAEGTKSYDMSTVSLHFILVFLLVGWQLMAP